MADIVRTQEEIDEVLNTASEIINTEGSRYHGMSFEEGIRDMYEWLVGNTDDNPLEL